MGKFLLDFRTHCIECQLRVLMRSRGLRKEEGGFEESFNREKIKEQGGIAVYMYPGQRLCCQLLNEYLADYPALRKCPCWRAWLASTRFASCAFARALFRPPTRHRRAMHAQLYWPVFLLLCWSISVSSWRFCARSTTSPLGRLLRVQRFFC